jgi:hypothetical protein
MDGCPVYARSAMSRTELGIGAGHWFPGLVVMTARRAQRIWPPELPGEKPADAANSSLVPVTASSLVVATSEAADGFTDCGFRRPSADNRAGSDARPSVFSAKLGQRVALAAVGARSGFPVGLPGLPPYGGLGRVEVPGDLARRPVAAVVQLNSLGHELLGE